MNATQKIAEGYARRGWVPIPVPHRQKGPTIAGWEHLTADESALMFNGKVQNIGVLLGDPSGGLLDVDLDSAEAIRHADQFLDETDAVFGRASKKRSHRLYQVDGAMQTVRLKDPHTKDTILEIRWNGAQTIFPGSEHPSGESVVWQGGGDPPPVVGSDIIYQARALAAAVVLGRSWPGDGGRHDAATALAGWFRKGGVEEDDAVLIINTASDIAGGSIKSQTVHLSYTTDRDVLGYSALREIFPPETLSRVGEWLGCERGKRGADPPPDFLETEVVFDGPPIPFEVNIYPEFPVGVLPTSLRRMVEAVAEETQTPVAMGAMLALSVVAGGVAKRAMVNPSGSWREPANIYTFTVAKPGERKSAVVRHLTGPLSDHQKIENAANASRIKMDSALAAALAREIKDTEKQLIGCPDGEIAELQRTLTALYGRQATFEETRTKETRLLVGNITPEKLAVLMSENDERMATFQPEGDIIDVMLGQYSGNPNINLYLAAHAGDEHIVDRIAREGLRLEEPALTMGLLVQPAVLRKMARVPDAVDRGLVARFLYAVPQSYIGTRREKTDPIPEDVRIDYVRVVRALYSLKPYAYIDGAPVPHIIGLDDDARRTFDDFRGRIEPKLGDWGELAPVRAWANKLAGAVARIALGFHVYTRVDGDWTSLISAKTIQRGIDLAEGFLVPHAVSALSVMGGDQDIHDAKRILEWLKTHARTPDGWAVVSKRDLFTALRHSFGDRVEHMDHPIAVLVRYGYLATFRPPIEGVGRPKGDRYVVNPEWNGTV